MGKVLHPLLEVGQSLTFTEAQLSQTPQNLRKNLTAIGVLESFVADSWICDTCDDEHGYHFMGGKLLKACENDISAQYTPVSADEPIRWRVNWGHLLRRIQTQNQLSLFSFPQFMPSMLAVGRAAGGILLIVLTCFGEAPHFRQRLNSLADIYPGYEMLLICVDSPLIDSITQVALKGKKCRLVSLESLIANSWVLDMQEPEETCRLKINRTSQQLIIDEVAIRLSPAAFTTALIIGRANGTPINEVQFSGEYYNLQSDSTRLFSISREMPTLVNSIFLINKEIRKQNVAISGNVFKSMRGNRGYQVVADFCPVLIL